MPRFKSVTHLLREMEENVYELLVVRELNPEDHTLEVKSIGEAIAEGFVSDEERSMFFNALGRYINPEENTVRNYRVIER